MEKSSTNHNLKKAVIVGDNNLLLESIKKVLNETGYESIVRTKNKLSLNDLRARLIIYIAEEIGEEEFEFLNYRSSKITFGKLMLITSDKKAVTKRLINSFGIDGIISIFDSEESLKKAILIVESDKNYISNEFRKIKPDNEELLNSLTKRQYQIYILYKKGKTTREIAESLEITSKTVKNQISNIRKTIGQNI